MWPCFRWCPTSRVGAEASGNPPSGLGPSSSLNPFGQTLCPSLAG
nr:MAG TPA: 1-acylglycerol-3-phospate O-acyltransferase [Caudoviricetes sp.]